MPALKKKILYVSGSIGLGHVTRDLAIARQLRRQRPEVELFWLASHPATSLLKEAGEELLPEVDQYADENVPAENAARGFHLNLPKYASTAWKEWMHNITICRRILRKRQFDVIIGDETYEIAIALEKKHFLTETPFVMINDFLGLDSVTENPIEKLAVYIWNRIWARNDYKLFSDSKNLALFAGELEDIPDKRLGFLLPNRRDHARAYYKFTGYILPFDPAEYTDKASIRAKLGYGQEPLAVCSIGGTSIGKDMLELCGQAYPIIRREVPDLRMVLVCGPRLSTGSLKVPEQVEVKGYVPALYEHFAASDLAIVQAGGTATLELTALRRPFLYFPLANHCEQQIHVAARLARHQAGVRMAYSKTTPENLAEKVTANLGVHVDYPPIPTDGARKAAQLITDPSLRKLQTYIHYPLKPAQIRTQNGYYPASLVRCVFPIVRSRCAEALVPRMKLSRLKCSLGPCGPSLSRPRPMRTTGQPNCSTKVLTTGIEPPHRMNTGSLPNPRRRASSVARKAGLFTSNNTGGLIANSEISRPTVGGHTD
jgi:UDP-N-acetylglucosamine:LPS N-acetylglucosamine transferase